MSDLASLVGRLAGKRVLVIGDLCLDEYLIGRAQRLSREAPIPVLELEERLSLPGAAANPALNIAALGGRAVMAGVIGDDGAARDLRAGLVAVGVATDGLVVEPGRPTTVKTRLLAESDLRFPQQVARIDRQDRRPLATATREALLAFIEGTADQVDALLVSDYRSGVVEQALIERVAALGRQRGKLTTADSQGDLLRFAGFTVVKCNRAEAEATLRYPLAADEDFDDAGRSLLERVAAQALVITRGSEGMTVVAADGHVVHLPAANRTEVFDVTGAGDTVIAVLTLALAAGADIADAACLANIAAGLVVRRLGNATVTPSELAVAASASAPLQRNPGL